MDKNIVLFGGDGEMNFINQLVEKEDSVKVGKLLPFNKDTTYRMFKGTQINENLWISIQASYGHYCSPRETIRDLTEYDSMEFALMNAKGDFITVTQVLPDFPRLKEIEDYECTVYGYVPVDLIEDLYNELIKLG